MEVIIDAVLYRNKKTETFPIKLGEHNYIIVRKKLERVQEQIIDHLRGLKDEGKIKSICCPKNKQMREELKELIQAKKTIKKSISKIKELYYK